LGGGVVGGLLLLVSIGFILFLRRKRTAAATLQNEAKPSGASNSSTSDVSHFPTSILPSISASPVTESSCFPYTNGSIPFASGNIAIHPLTYKGQCQSFVKQVTPSRGEQGSSPAVARVDCTPDDAAMYGQHGGIPFATAVAVVAPSVPRHFRGNLLDL
jgi:hypothetical protein